MDRNTIDKKYKWDLSAIYASEEAFYADFALATEMINKYPEHEKVMTDSAEALFSALRDLTDIEAKIEILWAYTFLGFAVDTSDNNSQSLNSKVRSLAVSADSKTWFVTPRILTLDESTLDKWFAEYPELETFRRRIEKIMKDKPHTLSDECEALMSKLGDTFGTQGNIRSIFANSDLRFGKIRDAEGKLVQLTDANYVTYLMSSDRRVRRAAFRTVYKVYEQFANTFATMYDAAVRESCTLAKVRGFADALTASTFKDEVTPEIYNNLIASVNRGLPALYDYYELKREVLGLDKLHLYDIYAPLIGSIDREYTYEESVEEVLDTVKIYGKEYYETLKAGLTERGWVDVFPTKGKRGGAFSAGCPGTEPYILLNYTNTFNDMSTLAHEAGHSMHSWFSINYNEPHNSQYTIFVAEVASTVNELLLSHKKLRECTSDEEKLYILNQLMETYKGTLYRQTMFAEFEKDMHELCESGEPLTASLVNERYYELVKRYFGEDVVCDKQIAYEWMRIPHFYRNFYVYKYATCISAASAIVKRIESEGEAYVGKYIDFLKCGGARTPLESLLVAGIDMRDPEVVNGAVEDFAAAVAEFRRIYRK